MVQLNCRLDMKALVGDESPALRIIATTREVESGYRSCDVDETKNDEDAESSNCRSDGLAFSAS